MTAGRQRVCGPPSVDGAHFAANGGFGPAGIPLPNQGFPPCRRAFAASPTLPGTIAPGEQSNRNAIVRETSALISFAPGPRLPSGAAMSPFKVGRRGVALFTVRDGLIAEVLACAKG